MKTVLYKETEIDTSDFSRVAKENKLTYEIVSDVVEQLLRGETVATARFAEPIRTKVIILLDNLDIEEVADEEPTKEQTDDTQTDMQPEQPEQTETPAAESLMPDPSEAIATSNYAAHQLIGAMVSTEGNHFIIDQDGICTINPSNPPPLAESYKVVGQVIQLHALKDNLEDKTTWLLGSVINALEEFHGTEFELSQMCDQTSKSYHTMWTAAHVFKVFKHKRYNLPFTHHKEVCFAKIDDDAKKLILSKAEKFELTARNCRALAVIAREHEDGIDDIKSIKSAEQAQELIKQNKIQKTPYILLNNNTWTRTVLRDNTIPIGDLVINLKEWTIRKGDGPAMEIPRTKPQPQKE